MPHNAENILNELASLLRMQELHQAFIEAFTEECSELSNGIVEKVIKRTIKRFNEKLDQSIFGDFPGHFTPFDCYCVFWDKDYGSCWVKENIRDCIESFIEIEYDNLDRIEQLVLDFTFFTDDYETSIYCVFDALYDSFMIEVDTHLRLKKIQNYLMNL